MLVGGAIGSKINKTRWLVVLIVLALASHYLLDSFPHYEYRIDALMNGLNIDFVIAALKVFWDFFLGLIFLILVCRQKPNFYYILAGSLIAILPDILLFLSWQIGNLGWLNFLVYLNYKFHYPNNNLTPLFLGLFDEILAGAAAIFVIFYKIPLRKKKSGKALNAPE